MASRFFFLQMLQSTIQKLTPWQCEVVRLTHVPLKTQNQAYSRLENNKPQNMSRNIIDNFFLHVFEC